MATQDDKKQEDPNKPCLPPDNVQIVPPPEVTSIVAGAGLGFALGLALGVALGVQIARK